MSSVMTLFLFWIMLIHKNVCTVVRPDRYNRNAFEYVIQKYMDPLRRLSADLPNHAIEMEIEFQGAVPREITPTPQRRVIRVVNARHPKNPKKILRDDTEKSESNALPQVQNKTTPDEPSGVTSNAIIMNPLNDTAKIPVFMDDLQKALDEFEKKLQSNLENSITKMPAAEETKNYTTAAPKVRSIADIVELLQKAQKLNANIEHRMPKAGDENLEWLHIKIPKKGKT